MVVSKTGFLPGIFLTDKHVFSFKIAYLKVCRHVLEHANMFWNALTQNYITHKKLYMSHLISYYKTQNITNFNMADLAADQ